MNKSQKKANGLMGDLESIKALLEEDELEPVPEALTPDLSQALNPPVDASVDAYANEETDHSDTDAAAPLLVDPLNSFDPKTGLSTPAAAASSRGQVSSSEQAPLTPETLKSPEATQAKQQVPTTSDTLETTDTAGTPDLTSLETLLSQEFHTATTDVMTSARALINDNPNHWTPQQTDELADALRVRIDGAVQQWIQTSLAAHAGELQQRLLNAVRDELACHLERLQSTPDS